MISLESPVLFEHPEHLQRRDHDLGLPMSLSGVVAEQLFAAADGSFSWAGVASTAALFGLLFARALVC